MPESSPGFLSHFYSQFPKQSDRSFKFEQNAADFSFLVPIPVYCGSRYLQYFEIFSPRLDVLIVDSIERCAAVNGGRVRFGAFASCPSHPLLVESLVSLQTFPFAF